MLISLLVLVELARRVFPGVGRLGWINGTLAMLTVGGAVLVLWGPGRPGKRSRPVLS